MAADLYYYTAKREAVHSGYATEADGIDELQKNVHDEADAPKPKLEILFRWRNNLEPQKLSRTVVVWSC